MKEHDWPYHYPEALKRISWCIDGEVAGPNAYWNKHLDESSKKSKLFVKNVMLCIFKRNGVDENVCSNFIEWILKRLTFSIKMDDTEFSYSVKKNKEGKRIFDKDEFYKMAKDELGFDKSQAKEMLNYLVTKTLEFYNMMPDEYDDPKYIGLSRKLKINKDGLTEGFSEYEEALLNDMIKSAEEEANAEK